MIVKVNPELNVKDSNLLITHILQLREQNLSKVLEISVKMGSLANTNPEFLFYTRNFELLDQIVDYLLAKKLVLRTQKDIKNDDS